MLEGRLLISGIMVVIFAGACGLALTYEPDARTLPLAIGIPGLLLTLIQFVKEWREQNPEKIDPVELPREVRMFGWFVIFVAGLVLFGFLYAGPVLVALYLYFAGHEKWYVCLIAAVVVYGILYGIFERFLGLPLFEGLVMQWIYG